MKTISKLLVWIIFILCFCQTAKSQYVSPIKDRWTINTSIVPEFTTPGKTPRNEIKLTLHKGINNFLETGIYLGHTKYWYLSSNGYSTEAGDRILTGVTIKAHFLPFIITAEDIRFDLYVRSRIGISQLFGDPNPAAENTFFQYCLGSGLAFYPTKKIGIFTEFGYDNKGLLGVQKWRLEYGLVFKFRRSQN
ncbi:MAG: hypothetical protein EOL88_07100 [Bacteroidia bacterium]|jgi:hypothetical protein|nr:hypothetical protein [Bacteroidales bacterium]MDD3011418.1 hypothetical protein [Bacteroidales bacterium]MDD3962505.1 hypothetical protein [Bacteroidales bacterium]MDY0286372.1 hypothetical protein [Bacteroidales bacterium]NCD41843.1 hypothetical protein [Bacteroidia bacterium]